MESRQPERNAAALLAKRVLDLQRDIESAFAWGDAEQGRAPWVKFYKDLGELALALDRVTLTYPARSEIKEERRGR